MALNKTSGWRYCDNHRGDGYHYGPEDCTVCRLEERAARLQSELDELTNEAPPAACPFCGHSGGLLATCVEQWSARPQDEETLHELDEHQCGGCGRSFWT